MRSLDGRVVIVTGAGRGIGRAHARLLAAEGARVVVNDFGTSVDGEGSDPAPADTVAGEIRAAGGDAVANHADVGDWQQARALIQHAIDTYGALDALVNNAGIIRDRPIWDMSEDDLDRVVRVNLKGHVGPTRWAAQHWRDRARREGPHDVALVHTSSPSILGIYGQSNYGAAKAGITTFSAVVAEELAPYGVRSNVIVPAARTRMADAFRAWDPERPPPRTLAPTDPDRFDEWDPGYSSPLVAHLVSPACAMSGQVFLVGRGRIRLMTGWAARGRIGHDRPWTVEDITVELPAVLGDAPPVRPPAGSPFDDV